MQNISLLCRGFCLAQKLELVSQTVKTGSILQVETAQVQDITQRSGKQRHR